MQKFIYERKFGLKDRVFLAAASIFFALYASFSLTYFGGACSKISDSVVRLHILANSDSETDQNIKLAVRDALLKRNTELLTAGVNSENAESYFEASKEELQKTANRVLKENGFDYGAEIKLCREIYPTRVYGELTFPSGEYTSVKVVLGSGKGHNWWCVMYPPLCIPAAESVRSDADQAEAYFDQGEYDLLTNPRRYRARLKCAEVFSRLWDRIRESADEFEKST